ncbi:MAG: signal peptidase I [Candidatus Moranbacteria bacterium]|nr:signal peptidase I [Candidatus Moranbacteria bacterium]
MSPNTEKPSPESDNPEDLSAGQFFLEMIKIFLLAAVIIIPVRAFLFQPFFVEGESMMPNFHNGEYLIVNEFGFKRTAVSIGDRNLFEVEPFRELSRQESVVFRSPRKEGQYLIKRVIGLPGETVEIRNSKIIITNAEHPDGFMLDEDAYLASSVVTTDMRPLTLGDGEYFLLGDNRMNSLDSRIFGPVGRGSIIGHVLIRAWPLTRAQFFR